MLFNYLVGYLESQQNIYIYNNYKEDLSYQIRDKYNKSKNLWW